MEQILVELIEEFYKLFGIKYQSHERWSLLLHRYFSFRLKYITVGKRNIRISNELSRALNSHPKKDECFSVFLDCVQGKDLNPYQSKSLINADFHDYMYNDWGIHHLHLNNNKTKPNDYFVTRSDYLLFVKVTPSTLYFIDIYLHKEKDIWGKKALIKIIHDNWPEVIANRKTGRLSPDLNDEEIQILRKKGYSFGINVNDTVGYLMLGDGHAVSGDNMAAGGMANEVHRWMYKHEALFQSNPQEFTRQLREQLQF